MKRVSATHLRTRLSRLLGEIERSGKSIEITMRGRSVARLMPMSARSRPRVDVPLFGRWKGVIVSQGDVMSPVAEWPLAE